MVAPGAGWGACLLGQSVGLGTWKVLEMGSGEGGPTLSVHAPELCTQKALKW